MTDAYSVLEDNYQAMRKARSFNGSIERKLVEENSCELREECLSYAEYGYPYCECFCTEGKDFEERWNYAN